MLYKKKNNKKKEGDREGLERERDREQKKRRDRYPFSKQSYAVLLLRVSETRKLVTGYDFSYLE